MKVMKDTYGFPKNKTSCMGTHYSFYGKLAETQNEYNYNKLFARRELFHTSLNI